MADSGVHPAMTGANSAPNWEGIRVVRCGESTSTAPVATLRDKFAMAALTGLLASQSWQDSPYGHDDIAFLALNQADAMMNARSCVPDAS